MLWSFLKSAFRARARTSAPLYRGLELRRQGRLREAEEALRKAATAAPGDAAAATNLAIVLLEQDMADEGIAWLERALRYDARFAPAHYNLANAMRASGQREQALAHYQAALEADPGFAPAREECMFSLLEVCDWDRAAIHADALRQMSGSRPAAEWMKFVSPLAAVYLGFDPALRKEVAAFHAAECARGVKAVKRSPAADAAPAKLKIAYLSRDFRNHPVGQLLGNVFSLHDRARFEVHAYSYGPDDGSIYRKSIAGAVDRFVDARGLSDDEFAADIARSGIHVAIDLAGHTTGNRLAVLARRPAPVQAHYLGYPSTVGAPWIDYFITDSAATPPALAAEFTEQLAYLPHCFMVSDGSDVHGADALREAEGLPRDAAVFCNFNNASRITRDMFRAWMLILRAVPGSVLWLPGASALTAANLRKEAQMCSVDATRLVFAQRVPTKAMHIARLALADLMLDTVGWHNGHSSTSDALWAGVPVLTAPAQHFAGRVAASLVHAAGLPELAVRDLKAYVETAVRLGNERAVLTDLTHKLADAKRTAPFFDTRGTVRDLESAYAAMWETFRAGRGARTIGLPG